MGKDLEGTGTKVVTEPWMWFVVRNAFGDDIGEARYLKFEDAAKALKAFCGDHRNDLDDVDGAMLGIVYKGEDRDYKCVLVQNHTTSIGNRFRSMYKNITERALAIPEIELAALKGLQMEYPFDEATQKKIDALEKRLGLYERDVDISGDLYTGKWRVHIVPPGGRHGLNNNVVNEGNKSLVEFWDMSADKTRFPEGQFVSIYSVDGLLSRGPGATPEAMMHYGLCLDYGNRDFWSVSGAEMRQVFDWFKHRDLMPGERYLEVHAGVTIRNYVSDDVAKDFVLRKLEGIILARDVACVGVTERNEPGRLPGVRVDTVFRTQTDVTSINTAMKAFMGFKYEVSCEEKKMEAEKKPLDQVIGSCEKVSKKQEGYKKKGKSAEEREK